VTDILFDCVFVYVVGFNFGCGGRDEYFIWLCVCLCARFNFVFIIM